MRGGNPCRVLKHAIPLSLSNVERLTVTGVDEAVNVHLHFSGDAKREVGDGIMIH